MSDKRMVWPARLTPEEDGGFVVSYRDIPEILTQGDDREDALTSAADALAEAIAGRMNRSGSLPSSSKVRRGEVEVALDAALALKAALYFAMREAGVSNVELGRMLGKDEREVRRMLSPRHRGTRVDTLIAGLRALGREPVVEVVAGVSGRRKAA